MIFLNLSSKERIFKAKKYIVVALPKMNQQQKILLPIFLSN